MKSTTFCNKKFVLKWAATSSIATAIQIYSQCTWGSYHLPWAKQSMTATAID